MGAMKNLKIEEMEKRRAGKKAPAYAQQAAQGEFEGNLDNISPWLFMAAIKQCLADGVGITFVSTRSRERLGINLLVNSEVVKNYFDSEGDAARFLAQIAGERYLKRLDSMWAQAAEEQHAYTVRLVESKHKTLF